MAKRNARRDGFGAVRHQPASLAGRFVVATATRQDAESDRLQEEMNRIKWLNYPSLAWATLICAARAYFDPKIDLVDISAAVDAMRRAFGDGVPVLELEALIRLALGDDDVNTDGIDEDTMVLSSLILITSAADEWNSVSRVRDVVIRAEAMVAERGIEPTLAP